MAGYNGWLLPEGAREKLLRAFPPHYTRVIAHHVTFKYPATEDDPLPKENRGKVVGVADDGQGVQALVIEIGGTSRRASGGTYHITWSLSEGRKPAESNDVIRQSGWTPVSPVLIPLEPTFFPH